MVPACKGVSINDFFRCQSVLSREILEHCVLRILERSNVESTEFVQAACRWKFRVGDGWGPHPHLRLRDYSWVRVLPSRSRLPSSCQWSFFDGCWRSFQPFPSTHEVLARQKKHRATRRDLDRIDPNYINQSCSQRRDRFARVTMASQQPLSSSQQPADVYGGGE